MMWLHAAAAVIRWLTRAENHWTTRELSQHWASSVTPPVYCNTRWMMRINVGVLTDTIHWPKYWRVLHLSYTMSNSAPLMEICGRANTYGYCPRLLNTSCPYILQCLSAVVIHFYLLSQTYEISQMKLAMHHTAHTVENFAWKLRIAHEIRHYGTADSANS